MGKNGDNYLFHAKPTTWNNLGIKMGLHADMSNATLLVTTPHVAIVWTEMTIK